MRARVGGRSGHLSFWQEYADEVLGDLRYRSVSHAALGVFTRLRAVALNATRVGYLVVSGRAATLSELARAVGGRTLDLRRSIDSLVEVGLLRVDDDGVLYAPDMVRRYTDSLRHQAHGRRGGNPHLTRLDAQGEARPRAKRSQHELNLPINAGEADLLNFANGLHDEGVNPEEEVLLIESRVEGATENSTAPVAETDEVHTQGDADAEAPVMRHHRQRTEPGARPSHTEEENRAEMAWNAMAIASRTCVVSKRLSLDRRRRLRTVLNEVGLTGFLTLVERIEKSDNLQGRGHSLRERLTFDMALADDFVLRLQEGNFDNRARKPEKPPVSDAEKARRHYWASRPRKGKATDGGSSIIERLHRAFVETQEAA